MPDPQLRSLPLSGAAPAVTNLGSLVAGAMTLPAAPTVFVPTKPSDPLQQLMARPDDALLSWIAPPPDPAPARLLSSDRPLLLADYEATSDPARLAEQRVDIAAFAGTNLVALRIPMSAAACAFGYSEENGDLPPYWKEILAARAARPDRLLSYRRDGGQLFGHLTIGETEEEILTFHYALLRNPAGFVPMLQRATWRDLDLPSDQPTPPPEPKRIRLANPGELRVIFEPRDDEKSDDTTATASCSKIVFVYDADGIVIRTIVLAPWPVEAP